MKQKLISHLVVGALAAIAASSSFAGQIQSSSVSIAREVITTNTQTVTSPSVSYRFFGDVDARLQSQTFQVQFILDKGATWATPGTALPTDVAGLLSNIKITDGVGGQVVPQAPGVASATHTNYTVDTLALGTTVYANDTLYATITVNQSASLGLIKQPIISISGHTTLPVNNPTINNLKQIVQDITECDTAVKTLPVAFKHFVALSAPGSLATESNATKDEHNRPSSQNETTLVTFPTNLKVNVATSTGTAKIDVSTGSTRFSAGMAGTSFVSTTLTNLGNVYLTQNASGYDTNLAAKYLLTGNRALSGLTQAATATLNNGNVEVKQVDVAVAATQGFQDGGSLFLSTAANCGAPIAGVGTVAITAANAAGPITLTVPTASVSAAFGNDGLSPVHVCYQAAGANVIPNSSFSVTAATLVKSDAGAGFNEQNNYCKGALYPLSGSIKIDVRNYSANGRTDGWQSVIRLINPSETRTVDVYGQFIHADGKYGKWGKLATLAPRAVLNMGPAAVSAALTNAPAHATTANNATADLGTSGDAPRLRITSSNSDTLRVQNYLYNPASQNFIEASSSQGVDFTGTTDRAPLNEGQYTEQDAQKGLNGGN